MDESIRDALVRGFLEELSGQNDSTLEQIEPFDAPNLGREAALYILSPILWSRAVGETLSTTEVCHLLGVSRQALAKRLRSGSLIGLPGRHSTRYPAWQFDIYTGGVRPEVRVMVSIFREELEEIDPFTLASWATTPQEEDLGGVSPADWLCNGKDRDALFEAARRAAARLAQ